MTETTNIQPSELSFSPKPSFVLSGKGCEARRIAVLQRSAAKENTLKAPTLVWFTGFRSSMRAVKAESLDKWAYSKGLGCVRFDYSGHGESDGSFTDGTISRWLEDALAVIHHSGEKRIVLIGSSMGGWLALRAAQILRETAPDIILSGLVLLAPAVNFTERLIWDRFSDDYREKLMQEGVVSLPYPDNKNMIPITKNLIEDGRKHLLYLKPLVLKTNLHILQGKQDAQVPWQTALELFEHCANELAHITFIEDGVHALERPHDLEKLFEAIEEVVNNSSFLEAVSVSR